MIDSQMEKYDIILGHWEVVWWNGLVDCKLVKSCSGTRMLLLLFYALCAGNIIRVKANYPPAFNKSRENTLLQLTEMHYFCLRYIKEFLGNA